MERGSQHRLGRMCLGTFSGDFLCFHLEAVSRPRMGWHSGLLFPGLTQPASQEGNPIYEQVAQLLNNHTDRARVVLCSSHTHLS